jgi:hypothetical protein
MSAKRPKGTENSGCQFPLPIPAWQSPLFERAFVIGHHVAGGMNGMFDHLIELKRQNIMKLGFATFALALCFACFQPLTVSAQQYSIDWYKIAGGGGTSTGGTYSVSGTIGQPDASLAMSGGNYSVTGGFWALVQVVQTPGAPTLYISRSGNAVTLYWLDVSGWNLHQNGTITTPVSSWAASGTPTLTNGTNYFTVTNPTGNVFFQLSNP